MSIGDFDNKVVLISGGGSGIGRATALAFAKAGASIIVIGRNIDTCQKTLSLLDEKCRKKSLAIAADIGSEKDVKNVFSEINSIYGRLDIAFFNAGVGIGGSIIDQSLADFEEVMRTNCIGLWLCMKYAMQQMMVQKKGVIINNLSVHSTRTIFPNVAAYTASKHAALAITKSAAVEVASHGLRINGIAPGPIMTDMLIQSASSIGGIEEWEKKIPQGRVGTQEEIANAVLWLSGDGASFVNGAVLNIDGGFLAS